MTKIIGIKSSLDKIQIQNKLSCNPPLLEIYGREEDLENIAQTKQVLKQLKEKGIIIYYHSPLLYDGDFLNLGTLHLNIHRKIIELCKDCKLDGYIIHAEPADSLRMVQLNLKKLRDSIPEFDEYAYVENVVGPLTKDSFVSFVEVSDIKNICFDISHFCAYHSQEELFDVMKQLNTKNVYYHISDHIFNDNNPDPLNLGNGQINLDTLFSLIEKGVIETFSIDEDVGQEIKADFELVSSKYL